MPPRPRFVWNETAFCLATAKLPSIDIRVHHASQLIGAPVYKEFAGKEWFRGVVLDFLPANW